MVEVADKVSSRDKKHIPLKSSGQDFAALAVQTVAEFRAYVVTHLKCPLVVQKWSHSEDRTWLGSQFLQESSQLGLLSTSSTDDEDCLRNV